MDFYGDDRKLSELGESDFNEFLDHEDYNPVVTHSIVPNNGMDTYGLDSDWLDSFFEDPVLNDRMISDALQPPHIQSEHSYSLSNDEVPLNLKMERVTKDMDTDLPLNLAMTEPNIVIKKECPSETDVCMVTVTRTNPTTNGATTLLKQPAIILATTTTVTQPIPQIHDEDPAEETMTIPKVSIKLEPPDASPIHSSESYDSLGLPPTPPSSSNSDSEGGLSPTRSAPSSPVRQTSSLRQHQLRTLEQPTLFTSPIPQSGVFILTEEEKRTLVSEGYPIPNKLPLTKQEEKNLKKIRRKIKNKISAQESRRKKKEYLETLEKRVESFNQENNDLKKKVDQLEGNNRSLMSQLQRLQSLAGKLTRPSSATSTQTGTCLMVLVLCFAVFLGSWSPSSIKIGYSQSLSSPAIPTSNYKVPMGPQMKESALDPYGTPNMRSRVLLSVKEESDDDQHGQSMMSSYCNILSQLFGGRGSEDVAGTADAIVMPQIAEMSQDDDLRNDTDKGSQASMHPDIAANITPNVLAMDQRQIDTKA